jgi:hypothetical protein
MSAFDAVGGSFTRHASAMKVALFVAAQESEFGPKRT